MLNDYLTLCKPRVVLLMLVTAWVGMYMANPSVFSWNKYLFATIGIAFAASSAAIINHFIDRHIDRKMSRTSSRPLASGRVKSLHALLFATLLAVAAWFLLANFVNMVTTILTFCTLFGYAIIYTVFLKHATPQNIVIGGLAGAMPPLLGWAAISGDINPLGLLLVLIIFTWTPPHFWALAIYRVKDYSAANIPMLPVTHGIKFTKFCLLLYTILLCAVTCLPFAVGMSGLIYLVPTLLLNGYFLYLALQLYRADDISQQKIAIKTFNFSITYLLLLFAALLIDRSLGSQLW